MKDVVSYNTDFLLMIISILLGIITTLLITYFISTNKKFNKVFEIVNSMIKQNAVIEVSNENDHENIIHDVRRLDLEVSALGHISDQHETAIQVIKEKLCSH